MNVAVVGGGISGLATAFYVCRQSPTARVTIYESSPRLGGSLETVRDGDYLLECAADNFLRGPTAPWAEALCQDMGFADQLIPTSEQNRGAHVVWHGRLLHVPAGFQLMAPSRFMPILKSPLLSVSGKLRLCLEPLIREPIVPQADESLARFATRRLGRQAFERLVEPLVAGIYTADPDTLSIHAALPQMVEMVQKHGSLYAGMRARRRKAKQDARSNDMERGARYGLFVAPRYGMQQWIDALQETLREQASIRLHTGVSELTKLSADLRPKWSVVATNGSSGERTRETYDAVVLALPAYVAGRLLKDVDDELAGQLESIEYASSAVVALGYKRSNIGRPLDAFGSVVPRGEGRPILALSYSSLKFPGRAPEGRVLIRVFLGGALAPQWADAEDAQLIETAQHQVRELLDANGQPELRRVIRWPRAMPQYHLGHVARLQWIDNRVDQHRGLCLAGNGYRGVGIPQCVHSGRRAADRLVAQLGTALEG